MHLVEQSGAMTAPVRPTRHSQELNRTTSRSFPNFKLIGQDPELEAILGRLLALSFHLPCLLWFYFPGDGVQWQRQHHASNSASEYRCGSSRASHPAIQLTACELEEIDTPLYITASTCGTLTLAALGSWST